MPAGILQQREGPGFGYWHHNVLDVVAGAVTGPRNRPTTLVAGLPMNGRLWIVGRSTVLTAAASRNLGRHLHPPAGNHPWPEEISPALLDRFTKDRDPVRLTLVEPMSRSRSV